MAARPLATQAPRDPLKRIQLAVVSGKGFGFQEFKISALGFRLGAACITVGVWGVQAQGLSLPLLATPTYSQNPNVAKASDSWACFLAICVLRYAQNMLTIAHGTWARTTSSSPCHKHLL